MENETSGKCISRESASYTCIFDVDVQVKKVHFCKIPTKTIVRSCEKIITMPKVGILNFCSGIRWTAALESVQPNRPKNAVTLQSMPPFGRLPFSEFRCLHRIPQSNTLNILILQWIPLNAVHYLTLTLTRF